MINKEIRKGIPDYYIENNNGHRIIRYYGNGYRNKNSKPMITL